MKFVEDIYQDWNGLSIAVVGNGTPSKNCGKEIDDHDIVIRFNGGPTKGYENLVGSKTTVMHLSDVNLLNLFPEIPRDISYFFSFYGKDDTNYRVRGKEFPVENMYLPKCFYWHEQVNVLGSRKPTAGFRQLYHLWKNNIKVDVYGIDYYKSTAYFAQECDKIFSFWVPRRKNLLLNMEVDRVHKPSNEKAFWDNNPYHNFH